MPEQPWKGVAVAAHLGYALLLRMDGPSDIPVMPEASSRETPAGHDGWRPLWPYAVCALLGQTALLPHGAHGPPNRLASVTPMWFHLWDDRWSQGRRVLRKGTRMEAAQKSYEEMADLFARGTTPAKILAFRPSRAAQARVHYLLARNKTGDLTPEEAAELERFGELEHLMQLVKARAHRYLERLV